MQRCFQEATALSRQALEQCLDEAVVALQTAEGSAVKLAERDALVAARTSLLTQRPTWGPRYAADLLAAFRAVPAASASGRLAGATSALPGTLEDGLPDFAGLTLVDDAQVSQDIEFARLSQQFRLRADAVMADFDALVSSAQGFPNVRPELNPLRPEVFAKVLRSLLDTASVEPSTRALWLKCLADPMGNALRGIYEKLLSLLETAKVQAVSYRMVPVSSGGGRGPAGRRADGGASTGHGSASAEDAEWAGAPSGGATLESFEDPLQSGVGDALFDDFLAHGGGNPQARLSEAYYARVEEELEALKAAPEVPADSLRAALPGEDAALPPVDRPVRRVDAQSSLSSRVWGAYAPSSARKLVRAELKKEATHVGQVLGLEVIRQLVSQVAQDPRLLAPVREAIVALEPSLLRLAMVDPRFFSDEAHPGRRLMERVAQRSFKYNDEYSAEFGAFFESVRTIFNALNALKIESAEPFSSALAGLEAEWARKDQGEDVRRQEVLEGLSFAEQRQTLADQIAFDMSSRPDLEKVPGVVLDFLFGPWALVMAHARLVDRANQIDPESYGLVVSDLVWSVKRDFTLRDPAKLMHMIPGLLRKLNAGLDLIALDAGERAPFFESLLRLHRPVLKLRRLKSASDAAESGALPLDSLPATQAQRTPRRAEQPWLAAREQEKAGFEDLLPSVAGDLEGGGGADVPDGHPGDASDGDVGLDADHERLRVARILNDLDTGCWVDLFYRQSWLRAQLVWASTKHTLFMFVSQGGRPHSMTRRSCERLVGKHWLRPVDSHSVVAHALAHLKPEGRSHDPVAARAPASAY